MSTPYKTLAKLTLPAEAMTLHPALDFVEGILATTGLEREELLRLRLGLEEAAMNVIEHAFDPGEEGYFDVVVQRRPSQVVLQVFDKGLPVDFRQSPSESGQGLGLRLIRRVADEVNLLNLGRDGKCVELIKNLPVRNVCETLSEAERKEIDAADSTPFDKADLELRFMTPEDASAMARCVYRSYGYSYAADAIYYPDKIRERIESGLAKSVVAVDKNSREIVGHLALTFPAPGARVADSGQAVVDPRYRGHNLFKKMKQFMVDSARTDGLYGIYSEAVTTHPFTQKGNLSLGAHETGFLLCFVSDTMQFRKIQKAGEPPLRQSAVLFYLRTQPEPHRVVYPPRRHRAMIDAIYKLNAFNRSYGEDETARSQTQDLTQTQLRVAESAMCAVIEVMEYGEDFTAMLKQRLSLLIEKKMEVIFLDLPMSNPDTARAYEEAEQLRFFFVGLIPEINGQGDVVRFLYLNGVHVQPDKYVRVSDFANELFDYIMRERERVS